VKSCPTNEVDEKLVLQNTHELPVTWVEDIVRLCPNLSGLGFQVYGETIKVITPALHFIVYSASLKKTDR
jgi:hypothetical protein